MENIIQTIREALSIPYHIDIVPFGSRSIDLHYPESDIDICVIHDNMNVLLPYIKKTRNTFKCTLKCNEPNIVVFNITSANVDLGFVTREKYNNDINHIHKQLSILFPSELDRKLYIEKVRTARLNNNMIEYENLKSWMKPESGV